MPPKMTPPKKAAFCAAFFLFHCSLFTQAAPDPVYSVTVKTDRPNAHYKVGEKVVFNVDCVTGGKPAADVTLSYVLRENDFKDLATGPLKITNGHGTLDHTWTTPGFLLLKVSQPSGKIAGEVGAACDPEKLRPALPKPDDFDAFWSKMKQKVDATPVEASLVPVPALTNDKIETYTLTMQNFNGSKVRCYFAKPKGNGPFPAYMELHGAGTFGIKPDLVARFAERGVMAIDMNPHDLELGQPEAFYQNARKTKVRGYQHIGKDNREASYFLQMFCADYRTAQYITSRAEWDQKHFVVHGSSQGGGQTLATSYLCPKVTAMAANICALCDHAGPLVGRAAGWPRWVTYTDGKPDPKELETSRYFDGVNFAQSITAKGLMSMGFIDPVCPPCAVYTAFNAYKGPKQVLEKPGVAHQISILWMQTSRKFIDQELGGIAPATATPKANYE